MLPGRVDTGGAEVSDWDWPREAADMSSVRDVRTGTEAGALLDRILAYVTDQGRRTWLVGGYVRDLLLGRASHDLDLIVTEGGVRLARTLAKAFGGSWFVLDAERDVGRAILPLPSGGNVEVDVARLRVPELLDDLALRDFTINAIAMDLSGIEAAHFFDPFDGRLDLERRLLRAVTEGAFRDDPLRMLRGVRMVAELGFRMEDATRNLVRRDAALLTLVAPERVRGELMRILTGPGAWQHLRLLLDLGLLPHILPESAAQVGVMQSAPHYQDVFDHSRSVLAHLEGLYALLWPASAYAIPQPVAGDPTILAPAEQWAELADLLAPFNDLLCLHLMAPLAGGRVRRDMLMWAAVVHDWGKPAKASEDPDGKMHFYDHDRWGALLVGARTQALRLSGDEVAYESRLTDLHMRPTYLARSRPLTRRSIYRFYRAAGSTGPDCVLLSLADHMASYASTPDADQWRRRRVTTRELLESYFHQHVERIAPPLLLDGNQIMAGLGLGPGPLIGELLEGLREAQAVGEVATAPEAWAWVRARSSQE